MKKYFGIKLEFDRRAVEDAIEKGILAKKKGYICVVDGNVLMNTYKDDQFQYIINQSFLNVSDGSSIALMASFISGQKFKTYTGPELFSRYILADCRQCILGNTPDMLDELKLILLDKGVKIEDFLFLPLPFSAIDDFDYKRIGATLNSFKPNLIWVSLGAPKQEFFMSKLLSHIDHGILFGIGAAVNFYVNGKTDGGFLAKKFNLIWVFRICREPRRMGLRALLYLCVLPRIFFREISIKWRK